MRYHTPTSFAEAATIAASASGTLRFLAGGTDVLVQMRAGTVLPDVLIDLKKIPGVDQITATVDGGSELPCPASCWARMTGFCAIGPGWSRA